MMTNSIPEIEKASHIVLVAADPYQTAANTRSAHQESDEGWSKNLHRQCTDYRTGPLRAKKITIPENGAGKPPSCCSNMHSKTRP